MYRFQSLCFLPHLYPRFKALTSCCLVSRWLVLKLYKGFKRRISPFKAAALTGIQPFPPQNVYDCVYMGGECQGHLPHPLKPSRITRIHAHTRTCVTRTRSSRQSSQVLEDFKAHKPLPLLTML